MSWLKCRGFLLLCNKDVIMERVVEETQFTGNMVIFSASLSKYVFFAYPSFSPGLSAGLSSLFLMLSVFIAAKTV